MAYSVTVHRRMSSAVPAVKRDRRVIKRMRALPSKHREQILKRIHALADIPRPQDCVKLKTPLEGYRVTIGEYRVLYLVDDARRCVEVYSVIQRGEGYPD